MFCEHAKMYEKVVLHKKKKTSSRPTKVGLRTRLVVVVVVVVVAMVVVVVG